MYCEILLRLLTSFAIFEVSLNSRTHSPDLLIKPWELLNSMKPLERVSYSNYACKIRGNVQIKKKKKLLCNDSISYLGMLQQKIFEKFILEMVKSRFPLHLPSSYLFLHACYNKHVSHKTSEILNHRNTQKLFLYCKLCIFIRNTIMTIIYWPFPCKKAKCLYCVTIFSFI